MPQRASVFCNFYIRVDREALVSERALNVGSVAFKAMSTKRYLLFSSIPVFIDLQFLADQTESRSLDYRFDAQELSLLDQRFDAQEGEFSSNTQFSLTYLHILTRHI
jgi:hypothetical protein